MLEERRLSRKTLHKEAPCYHVLWTEGVGWWFSVFHVCSCCCVVSLPKSAEELLRWFARRVKVQDVFMVYY